MGRSPSRRRGRVKKVLGDRGTSSSWPLLGSRPLSRWGRILIPTGVGKERRWCGPGWKRRVGYGQRWMAETFLGFKRLFGEVVQKGLLIRAT